MATKSQQREIGELTVGLENTNRKLDEVCKNLSEHIDKQDAFEEKVLSRMDDLGFILTVFRWMGWAITVGVSAGIIWFVNHFLNTR